jgi:hypothetical protein
MGQNKGNQGRAGEGRGRIKQERGGQNKAGEGGAE